MLRQFELVEKVRSYDADADEDALNRAYVFTMKAHGAQLRASGDPYFSHPIEVAGILTDFRLDSDTIITAILHDTLEDTVATHEQIEKLFGTNVAKLVDGVTKLSRIEAQSENERAAENFRKFLLAMSDDIRVLLVKLADRLHNMRTLHFIPSAEKRQRISRETMDIYAPLAERIGMYELKDELIEIAFRELQPEAWQSIARRLEHLRVADKDLVPRVVADLKKLLQDQGIEAEVFGREKRPHSIWKKMQERHVTFEQLSDVVAFRVLVADIDQVYRALGAIHMRWPFVPGRFKDFISTPKSNGYRSLHTTVMSTNSVRIEVQLRTQAMHREAEFGLAAHWAYKQGKTAGNGSGQHYPWLADLLEILEHGGSPEEFLELTKLAMYQDQVFCFTPRGELIQLPRGATPVDFAFAVHTDLGETTVGSKVNGRIVPLRTRLDNGDQVEILASDAQQPDPAWEGFVVTAKARAAIRRFRRHKEREDGVALGRRLLDALTAKLSVALAPDAIRNALGRLHLPDEEALYLALARHDIPDDRVLAAIVPGATPSAPRARRRKKADASAAAPSLELSIKGLTPGAAVHLADCCHPIPGDRIVGIRASGKGIMVHTIDCDHLEAFAHVPDRWLDLSWQPPDERPERFVARLAVVLTNEPGSWAAVATLLASNEANIANLKLSHRDVQFHTYVLDVEVSDLSHLTNIIAALRAARVVSSVERVRD